MSPAEPLAFHAADAEGRGAVVLLLERGEAGRVRCTEWQAAGFAEPGVASEAAAEEVERRIAAWERAGWRFTVAPVRIRDWLRQV